MRKIILFLLLLLLCILCFFGCSENRKYYIGENISQDEITRYSEEISESESLPNSENSPTDDNTEQILDINIYYWTPDGGKYHIFRDCSALSKADTVLSGTIEAGISAGKSGLCKICEKKAYR